MGQMLEHWVDCWCRNWAAGARWSGCVAAFRSYPEPNLDPLGYLEVRSCALHHGFMTDGHHHLSC